MTHDELLEKVDLQEARWSDERSHKALRAVVELHKPFIYEGRFNSYERCAGCTTPDDFNLGSVYPCPTIQAIEKELN